jgi:hypothetical protein
MTEESRTVLHASRLCEVGAARVASLVDLRCASSSSGSTFTVPIGRRTAALVFVPDPAAQGGSWENGLIACMRCSLTIGGGEQVTGVIELAESSDDRVEISVQVTLMGKTLFGARRRCLRACETLVTGIAARLEAMDGVVARLGPTWTSSRGAVADVPLVGSCPA